MTIFPRYLEYIMKLIKKSFLQQIFIALFIYFLMPSLAAQEIKMFNVPDPNFRYMLRIHGIHFDTENNITNPEKAAQIEHMEVPEYKISNLSGIEAFTSLKYLRCPNNKLAVIDLSSNTALIELDVRGNQLTDLDISKNTSLTHIDCYGNRLRNLNVSANSKLSNLFCNNNELTTLDVSKNRNLVFLTCENNQLRQLDLSQNHKLLNLQYGNLDNRQVKISWRVKLQYLLNDIFILDTSNDTKLVYRLIFDSLLLLSILFMMFRNPDIKKQSIALYVFMILFWIIDIIIKNSIEYGKWKFDILILFAFWILSFVLITIFFLIILKTKKTKWDWMLFFLCTPIMPLLFLGFSDDVSSLLMQKHGHGVIQNFVGESIAIVVIVVLIKRHSKKQHTDRIL